MSRAWQTALAKAFTNLALEGVADGKIRDEREHVLFAEMIRSGVAHFPELDKAASWEYQQQWEIRVEKNDKNGGKGGVRVRKTYQGGENFMTLGEPKYELCVKLKAAEGHMYEAEVEIPEEMFKIFQYLCDRGMDKDRYYFPVEGGVFEVDMFLLHGLGDARLKGVRNRGASYCEWCKIDFEYKEAGDAVPPLPFKVAQLISEPDPKKRSAEENKILDHLFKDVFNAPNPLAIKN